MLFALPRFERRLPPRARFCDGRQWFVNQGRTVFSQLLGFLPDREFRRCVARYGGDARPRGFSCWDQYLSMAFAQLTYRDGLRDMKRACDLWAANSTIWGFTVGWHAPRWPTPTTRMTGASTPTSHRF